MKNPYIIASCMRSGTHFLGSLISSTKLVGKVREFDLKKADHTVTDEDAKIVSVFEHYHHICASGTGHWGLIIQSPEINKLERWFDIFQTEPKDLKWIWLVRRDKFAQGISMLRAEKLRMWSVTNKQEDRQKLNESEVDIKSAQVCHKALDAFFCDQAWETFFDTHGIEYYKLFYEDFVDESSWESMVAGVLDFLGVSYHLPLDVSTMFYRQRGKEKHKTLYNRITRLVNKRVDLRYLPFERD